MKKNIYHISIIAHCPISVSLVPIEPRKPKNLLLNKSITKVSDLRPMLLAATLARLHPSITEMSLMKCGGELAELKRKHLQDFRPSDTSQSLELRLNLANGLANAEKAWRGRMVQILSKGGGSKTNGWC